MITRKTKTKVARKTMRKNRIGVVRSLRSEFARCKRELAAVMQVKTALEFAMEAGQIGYWDLDLVHDTSRRSLRHDQCFGYSKSLPNAEWGVEKLLRHIHPEDRVRVKAAFRVAVGTLQDLSVDFRVVWPDGSIHWLAMCGRMYQVSEGRATRMLGTVVDVTDRKRVEAAMLRTERYLNDAQRLTCTGSFLVNFTTKEHRWSDETYRIYEYDSNLQPSADLVLARVHPDDRPALQANFARRHLAEPIDLQYRLLMPDGRIKHVRVRGAPVESESASPGVTYAGALVDITETKLAEDALRAAEQLSRGQVETLKSTLDALAMEPTPNRLLEHILRVIAKQTGAHSLSVWCQDEAGVKIELESVYEDDRVITKDDPRFAGIDVSLTIADVWPWPEVFHTGKPSLIQDIRDEPSFGMRDRLLPFGIVSVLLVPMSVGGRYQGAIGLRFVEKRQFRAEEMELAQALANQALLVIQFIRLTDQSREAAVIAERNRIARDMHDTLAQGFTGVIVQLEAAEDAKLRKFPKEADEHLVRARELARESLNEARRSVSALRPQALDGTAFGDALRALFSKMTKGTGLTSEFTVTGQPQRLPPDLEENLFRVGQEILTNTLRHAQASHFTAKLAFDAQKLSLDLRDNGQGFDPSVKNDGYGLLGIRERVEGMGGELSLESAKGKGTAISITLPTTKPPRAQMS
jgi:signal transduction histidine kinase